MTLLLAALVLNLMQGPELSGSAGGPAGSNSARAAERDLRPLTDSLARLADEAERFGDLTAAAGYLAESSQLAGNADPDAARRLAAVYGWMHEYAEARSWLGVSLDADPGNAATIASMNDLASARSVHLFGTFGGSEVDYARQGGEAGMSLGAGDRIDIIADASFSDRFFYTRQSYALDAWYYPGYPFALRFGVREKIYSYPHAADVRPDDAAYVNVPDFQGEASYLYGAGNEAGVQIEYFRPNLYWNRSLRASNVKLSASVKQRIAGPLRAGIFAAWLRDPQAVTIDPASGTASSIRYGGKGLAGGSLEVSGGAWSAEVKFVPDRDLDRSIDNSVFVRLEHEGGPVSLRYDFLYDRYAASAGGLPVSTVHMATVSPRLARFLETSAGIKILSRGVVEAMPFLSIRYATGW